MKKSTLFNCKDLDACKDICSISKRFAILLVMMVMVGNVSSEIINGLNYSLDEYTKTATLMANGEKGYSGNIVVPKSVKAKDGNVYTIIAFGLRCFENCTSLTSISIPSSVTSLGSSCFENCTSLTSISIPSSVTSLGSSCFDGCI